MFDFKASKESSDLSTHGISNDYNKDCDGYAATRYYPAGYYLKPDIWLFSIQIRVVPDTDFKPGYRIPGYPGFENPDIRFFQ